MRHLVSFSLKYNCSNDILHSLTKSCRQTLRRLDVEHSRNLAESSVPIILQFNNLEELAIAKTNLSPTDCAHILQGLPNIRSLPRGEFLCEALHHWSATAKSEKPLRQLKVRNFWASEYYFFHSTSQMRLVSELCPDIEEMLFMYQDRVTCNLQILGSFSRLQNLELWGGSFFRDSINHLLLKLGPRLSQVCLDLHHVDGLDREALGVLAASCPGLAILGFNNCDFNSSASRQQDFALTAQTLKPLFNLQQLSISCPCPEPLLVLLLGACLNLKKLVIGMTPDIGDSTFQLVFSTNRLEHLESLEIRQNTQLTLLTLSCLLVQCNNLHSVVDVAGWQGVSREELEELKEHMRISNIDILFE